MRYLKLAPWGVSAIAFLVVASLFVNFAMTAVDFYDGLERNEQSNDVPDTSVPDDGQDDGQYDDVEDGKNDNDSREYVTNLSNALGIGFVEGLVSDISYADKELYDKLTKDIPSLQAISSNVLIAVGKYDSENSALVKSGIELDGDFSLGKKTVKVAVKKTSSSDASVKIVYEDREVDIKTVELYMGYIIINSVEGVSSLCSGDGVVLVENMGDKLPANKRTVSGKAVFIDASGAYYILSEEKNAFESVSENSIVASLEYDYPAFSYKNDKGEQIYAFYDKAKKIYRYYNAATEKQEISSTYTNAYSFGESGYALIKTSAGAISIIDSSGKNVYQFHAKNFFYYDKFGVNQGAYVRRYYALPYTNDIGAIGSGTVDEYGWMRIRIRLIGRSASNYNKTVADYETLVNLSGELFDIPRGYTLESYSDGVMILSQNGRYGYYSIDKKWIAQPIYTYAAPFVQGLAVVGCEGGTLGMIDAKGNIVLPFVFSHISNVSSGLVSAYSRSAGWEIFKIIEKTEGQD